MCIGGVPRKETEHGQQHAKEGLHDRGSRNAGREPQPRDCGCRDLHVHVYVYGSGAVRLNADGRWGRARHSRHSGLKGSV